MFTYTTSCNNGDKRLACDNQVFSYKRVLFGPTLVIPDLEALEIS